MASGAGIIPGCLAPDMAADQIEHLAADAELRVDEEGRTDAGLECLYGFQQPKVARLHQIVHLHPATLGQTNMEPGRQPANHTVHFGRQFPGEY